MAFADAIASFLFIDKFTWGCRMTLEVMKAEGVGDWYK